MNNELVYRRVKTFDPMIEFATANQLPLGIMKTADSNYHFKINDISIYQDKFNGSGCNCHNSIYCTPYSANSCATITDVLTDYICVYSSAVAGIQFKDIDINFVPKTIDLKINLTMANLIVAYDDADIIATLQEVIKKNMNQLLSHQHLMLDQMNLDHYSQLVKSIDHLMDHLHLMKMVGSIIMKDAMQQILVHYLLWKISHLILFIDLKE